MFYQVELSWSSLKVFVSWSDHLSAEVLRDVDVAALQESRLPQYLLLVSVGTGLRGYYSSLRLRWRPRFLAKVSLKLTVMCDPDPSLVKVFPGLSIICDQLQLLLFTESSHTWNFPVVEKADLYGAVTSELWSVVDPTHAAHRDVPPDVQLLLEHISHLVDTKPC